MKFFWGGCEFRQSAYLAGADRLGARDRAALEAHATTCAECADALRNVRPVDAALRGAFAPLRERRTIVAPGRVRMAVGPASATSNRWLHVPRFFGRLTEVTVMVSVTLFAVGGLLDSSTRSSVPAPATHSVIEEYFRSQPTLADINYLRWLRLGNADDFHSVSTRLPMGGRFDGNPVEIQKGPGASPR